MASSAFHTLVRDGSPFALAQAMVAGREQSVFRHGPATLPEIYRKASRTTDRPVLVAGETAFTMGNLLRKAGAYAQRLAGRDIGPGTRVALIVENEADWIAAFIALTSLGAIAVLTDDADSTRQAVSAGCSAIVTDQKLYAAIHENAVHAQDVAMMQDPVPLIFPDLDPELEACIAFTSGSSGDPKGVVLTHRGITTGLMNMMLAGAFAARTSSNSGLRTRWVTPAALLRTPLHHVSGYMQLLLMLITGGRIVRSSRTGICTLIAEHQITSVIGISDEEIAALLDTGSAEALWPLRSITVTGRSLSAALRQAVRKVLPDLGLGAGYGLTETNGLVCAIGNAELAVRPQSVGPLLPTVECRITRQDGQDCVPGEHGTIRLRGAMLMRGYCQGQATDDGWFVTGDVGYLSDDGYLHVLDREERFLRDGDRRISCHDIEEAARAATGLPDIAALPLRENGREGLMIVAAAQADLSQLRTALARQFPAEIIGNARFLSTERLPRTASGKIAYARLMEDTMP